jgi:2-polyprenyl-3-methyl-5-hydroxy-6-metoxy-1,4-benzoquinol methylase
MAKNNSASQSASNGDFGALSSSFRDPSGFVFKQGGVIYRQVNTHYQEDYDMLMNSGLYEALVKENLLIPHSEAKIDPLEAKNSYKVIRPEHISHISYPYEWSFSQYQDAALVTLRVLKIALEHGMTLKDASAYNIQFHKGRAVFMDTLSFQKYPAGEAWVGYKQFCQHFLAPLALASKIDIRLLQLMRIYIDGVPLDLAAQLLPFLTKINQGLLMHLHIHAKSQTKYADNKVALKDRKQTMSMNGLNAIITNLENTVKGLHHKDHNTEWAAYYTFTNYTDSSFRKKKDLVEDYIELVKPKTVWDLGANNGEFSRIASDKNINTVAWDIDPMAVEFNYQMVKTSGEEHILPLVLDLTNPSGGIGWAHAERESVEDRGPADLVLALAIIHHIRITGNIPLSQVAKYLSNLGRHLVIEFVPKGDSQVDKLLLNREDIFSDYDQDTFEKAFKQYFSITKAEPIHGSKRTLYLMKSL